MPRDINGVYELPGGNPVSPNTTIEDTWANTTMNDIKAALTDSLSRTGQGGMQAPLFFGDGVVAGPGIAWANETGTGFYRAAAGDMRLVQQGYGDAFRWLNRVAYTRTLDNSAWAAVVYEGGVGSVPSGTANLDTLVWNIATSKWTIQVKNAGGVLPAGTVEKQILEWDNTGLVWIAAAPILKLPVGSATNLDLQWNNTTMGWDAVPVSAITSLINAGTVTDQSTRWDNVLLKWVPNSNVTITDLGLVTAAQGFVGGLFGNCTGSSGSCTGNSATATLATNSSQLGGVAATGYPQSTTVDLFVIQASAPAGAAATTVTFTTT